VNRFSQSLVGNFEFWLLLHFEDGSGVDQDSDILINFGISFVNQLIGSSNKSRDRLLAPRSGA
jgi:hypothetical protein